MRSCVVRFCCRRKSVSLSVVWVSCLVLFFLSCLSLPHHLRPLRLVHLILDSSIAPMAIHRNPNFAITLLFALVILLALAPPSSANAVSPDVPYRRDHVNLNRMIKRRTPLNLLPRQHNIPVPQPQAGAVGAAADPSTDGLSSPAPSSTPAAPSVTQAQQTSQTPISSAVPSVLSSAVSSFPFFFWEIFYRSLIP